MRSRPCAGARAGTALAVLRCHISQEEQQFRASRCMGNKLRDHKTRSRKSIHMLELPIFLRTLAKLLPSGSPSAKSTGIRGDRGFHRSVFPIYRTCAAMALRRGRSLRTRRHLRFSTTAALIQGGPGAESEEAYSEESSTENGEYRGPSCGRMLGRAAQARQARKVVGVGWRARPKAGGLVFLCFSRGRVGTACNRKSPHHWRSYRKWRPSMFLVFFSLPFLWLSIPEGISFSGRRIRALPSRVPPRALRPSGKAF